MKKYFVKYYSPGTFMPEVNTEEVEKHDVEQAKEKARNIIQRYGATPFGFRFVTRERGENDFDSKETFVSPMHWLGGTVLTLDQVIARNDPKDKILISNRKGNKIEKVIENNNS